MNVSARICAAAVVTLMLTSARPAAATTPQEATISVLRNAGQDTWSSVGAISDMGTFADSPGVPEFFAGQSSTFHVDRTFTGSGGTITMRGDVRILATDDPNVLVVDGNWAVLSGTLNYSDLHGTGSISETFDLSTGIVQGTWEGSVHSD